MVSRHKRLLLGEVLMCSEAFDIHAPAIEHVADGGRERTISHFHAGHCEIRGAQL